MDMAVPNKPLALELSSYSEVFNLGLREFRSHFSAGIEKAWETQNELAVTIAYDCNAIILEEGSTIFMPSGEHRVIKMSDGSF